ncbi:unnamed protein product [Durusdinium trenchii]|uniref:Uncharacterized protein n=2 Tax=Durusdinium trenchii TaxID=1381693 RepID=A0ABP0L5M9_9DINO
MAGTEIRTDEGVVIFEGSPHKAKVLYGNLLWTGALALSKFFATSSAAPPVKGRSCLELGAGTGVVGLTLGSMGAEPVFITDNEPELLLLMKKNIEANNLSDRVQTFCLDWADGKSFMQQLPDLVVAADVLYEGDGSMFCHALAKHLRIGAEAYVANHHNPDKCEDSKGFAIGSLRTNTRRSAFQEEAFHPLNGNADAPWTQTAVSASVEPPPIRKLYWQAICTMVRGAKFHQPDLSPMEHIQIFRLSRPISHNL